MNVLAIGASARLNGNSNALLGLAVEGARARGATVEVVHARRLSVQGCLGCEGCKRSPTATCVVRDDMHDVYARLRWCDALLLATPVYFYSMSSWLKAIIDRLYGLLDSEGASRIEGGKSFYVITTEEEADAFTGREIVRTLSRALAWLRMDLRGDLVAVGLAGVHDWEQRQDYIEAARALIAGP